MTVVRKKIWVVAGVLLCMVGIIGTILPMMPGLVFFILASYCFARGSRKFLRMLLSNKTIGPQIMDFKRGRGMLIKTKMVAIAMVIVSMMVSALYMVRITWVKYAIVITCAMVVLIILKQKTRQPSN